MVKLAGKVDLIRDVHEATLHFTRFLRAKGFKVEVTLPRNFGRHRLIITKIHRCLDCREIVKDPDRHSALYGHYVATQIVKFYLAFQRRWFESFYKYFGVNEMAVTLNKSIVEYCVKHGIDRIVFVHSDGAMFMISPKTMLKTAIRNKWIRTTRKTKEETIHLPLSHLKRIVG